ncbi:phage tail protein [Enterobacter kobei]|uniref:phage tail fiber protein n=1 Tax=Enterobacter kobei TaxID=208224 RepID=UPI0030760B66
MGVGAFGLGITLDGASTVVPLGGNETTGFGYWNSSGGGVFPGQWQVGLNIKGGGAVGGQFILNAYAASPRAIIRCRNSTNPNAWAAAELYTTANTTKSSDGTLKAASPVARIVKSREETERADVAEDGFSWCGCGTANSEAEGISLFRLDIGVYVLAGSAGLASEGWQLLPPMDPGGMGELGVVEAVQTDNGELTIHLFKRKYMLGDDGRFIDCPEQTIPITFRVFLMKKGVEKTCNMGMQGCQLLTKILNYS